MAYASSTRGHQNLAALRQEGIALLFSPLAVSNYHRGWRHALDNGAWSAFTDGAPFDFAAFGVAVDRWASSADFVIAPDVVGDARTTLAWAEEWVPQLVRRSRLVLIAAQDGMCWADVARFGCGIAIGGSTGWKLRAIRDSQWRKAPYLHVLRVNTRNRIEAVVNAGADSFDGTSPTRFSCRARDWSRWMKADRQEGFQWA